jgi:hypothetical protein
MLLVAALAAACDWETTPKKCAYIKRLSAKNRATNHNFTHPELGLSDECSAHAKVFNVGLPRSGTTWFSELMRNFHLRALHCNEKEGCHGVDMERLLSVANEEQLFAAGATDRSGAQYAAAAKNERLASIISRFDAFGDHPWYYLRAEVVRKYAPRAVFFATVRESSSWMRSFGGKA